jgi:cell division protein FtsQ
MRRGRPGGRLTALRAVARCGALAVLAGAFMLGVADGGHLAYDGSPWPKLPGKLAGFIGLAAEDVRISGLIDHEPDAVLAAIGVSPGAPLVGFDAGRARGELEKLDWVESAKVMRLFPNQLEISVSERRPFAIWQRDGGHVVIDRTGATLTSIAPGRVPGLLVVSGDGAAPAAAGLVDALAANEDLRLNVKAASRSGNRRWTLYLDGGAAVALPEEDIASAMARFAVFERETGVAGKGASLIDMRIPDRITVAYPMAEEPKAKLKVSRKQ